MNSKHTLAALFAPALFALSACGAANSGGAKTATDAAEGKGPSGDISGCAVQRNVTGTGGKKVLVVVREKGGPGFAMPLPEAQDSALECDGDTPFHGLSQSLGLEVVVVSTNVEGTGLSTPRAYLDRIAGDTTQTFAKDNVRTVASTAQDISAARAMQTMQLAHADGHQDGDFPGTLIMVAAPGADKSMTLLMAVGGPSAAPGAAADVAAHFFPADASGSLQGLNAGRAFAGVSSKTFSSDSVKALKKGLGCTAGKPDTECSALDKFLAAKPLSAKTDGAWVGRSVILVPGAENQAAARSDAMVEGLRLKGGLARMSVITPSDEKERAEMAATLTQILAGKGPAKTSDLRMFVANAPEQGSLPTQQRGASLSWVMPAEAGIVMTEFARETAAEVIVVGVSEAGEMAQVTVIPKN